MGNDKEIVDCPAKKKKIRKASKCPDRTCDTCPENQSPPAREDAYIGEGKKRPAENYQGRKPSEMWSQLKKAQDILTFKHIEEWNALGINKEQWVELCLKLTDGLYKNIPPEQMPMHTGFSAVAVAKMINEHLALWDVYELFKKKLIEAINRKDKNEDSKLFLNTACKIWGDHIKFVLDDVIELRSGPGPSNEKMKSRIEKVKKEIYQETKKQKRLGDFYPRDLTTFLCSISHAAYIALFLNMYFERLSLKYKIKRLEALQKTREIINEYNFSLTELGFTDQASPLKSF